MLPTIDISLIGVLLAVWHVVVTIWGYFTSALNWITQRALSLALGSKFWATAFFLTGSLALISLFSVLIQYILTAVAGLVVSTVSFSVLTPGLNFLSLFIDLSEFSHLVSFIISCFSFYLLAQNYTMWYVRIYGTFLAIRRSFKV